MIRKIFKGIIVSSAIAVLPVLGNTEILYYLHIWILFAIGFLASIFQPNYSLVNDKSNARDKGTEIQIIWSVYITQLFAVLEAAYIRFPGSVKWDILTTLSLFAMMLGLALRSWAIYTLGNFFTASARANSGKRAR